MKLVLITWIDSCGVSQDWQSLREPNKDLKPIVTESVGWIPDDVEHKVETSGSVTKTTSSGINDGHVVITPHRNDYGEDPQGCGAMAIPSCCIQRVTRLVEEANQVLDGMRMEE